MNYSNDSRKKSEQHNKSKTKQKKKKGKVSAFRVIIMSLIIGIFAIVGKIMFVNIDRCMDIGEK